MAPRETLEPISNSQGRKLCWMIFPRSFCLEINNGNSEDAFIMALIRCSSLKVAVLFLLAHCANMMAIVRGQRNGDDDAPT